MAELDLNTLQIVGASHADLPAILAIFDHAVEWLVAKGITEQWGTTPFSQLGERGQGRFTRWIDNDLFYIAKVGDQVVGTIVINPEPPPYTVSDWNTPRNALYIEAFATERRYEGHGIGERLLSWAANQARQRGIEWLRLDCWAGNPDLRAYYRGKGFTECGSCSANNGAWTGTLFEKQLA